MDGLNDLRAGDRTCDGFRLADIVELRGTDNARHASGEPGPGLALATWLADYRGHADRL